MSVSTLGKEDLQADLEAIQRLHERDLEASRARDFKNLRALMTEDAVFMPPGAPWRRGKEELDTAFATMAEAMAAVDVVEYDQEFEEIFVLGDFAIEWGTASGATRLANGELERSSFKLMRILQRQPDGEWKVHRSIWNANPAATESA